MKARVASKTLGKEQQRQSLSGQEKRGEFAEIDASESAEFGKHVRCPHEATQVLHPALAYSSCKVLLLIGNAAGGLEPGFWMTFFVELMDAHQTVVEDP